MLIGEINQYYIDNPSIADRLDSSYDTLIKIRNILIIIVVLIIIFNFDELIREISYQLISFGIAGY